MQFAFTDEQELLRREARQALGNGGWSRDDIASAELGFIYQAVPYQLADTYVETELARSLAYWAAWCVAENDEQKDVAIAAAKAYASDAAVAACERSIQVHGGIGFTWEHVLHEYYKRALWIQAYGGYPRAQRAKF